MHIPLGYGKLFTDRRHNWCYATEPQPEFAGRAVIVPRGKVLGGSSSINGMIYIRGQAEDFDLWRQLGNAGWGMTMCCLTSASRRQTSAARMTMHGGDGPLAVSDARDRHPLALAFVEAARSAAIRATTISTARRQEGAGLYQTTTRGGVRCSAATGLPETGGAAAPICASSTDALTTRILFEGRRATGIEYSVGGETQNGAGDARGRAVVRRVQFAAAAAIVRRRTARLCCNRSA